MRYNGGIGIIEKGVGMDDELLDELEPVEAYCVRCRETIEVIDPVPVWTRKGLPATRGECPVCGGVVFRLGDTDAHHHSERPAAVQVADNRSRRIKLPPETIYINAAAADQEIALQIAADLDKFGIRSWVHEVEPEDVDWASRVHPALGECSRMIYLLSPAALGVETVETAWTFFKQKRKPIIIAQVAAAEPPDPIRRAPRFDFAADYRAAFRQMIQTLNA